MSEKLGRRKLTEKFLATLKSDGNDSWALVELYRWQHGELPQLDNPKPLDVAAALRNMAEVFVEKDQSLWPIPTSVASVLMYVAKLIPDNASTPPTPDASSTQ